MKKLILITLLLYCLPALVTAQDTLPRFSLINAGNNRIIIGWVNKFENVKQISIQRSFDSLTGFKSILTVADPASPQNGFLDAKAPNDHMFYRIYIMLDKGMYLFSDAKRPVRDTLKVTRPHVAGQPDTVVTIVKENNPNPIVSNPIVPDPVITGKINLPDSIERVKPLVIQLNGFPGSVDSVNVPSPVTLKNKPNAFVPSIYVYTARDGYVSVKLPDEEKPKKYSIKFFEEDKLLFELKEIKEKEFKLDKTNFYHAGWFRFELYEDGKLLEKHKFYLEKEF